MAIARGNGTPAVQGLALGYHYELAASPRVKPGEDPLFIGEGGWGFAAPAKPKNPGDLNRFPQDDGHGGGPVRVRQDLRWPAGLRMGRLQGRYQAFQGSQPNNPNVKASKFYTSLLSQTEYYGEGSGYIAEIEKAGAEVASLVRQQKLDSAAAVKRSRVASMPSISSSSRMRRHKAHPVSRVFDLRSLGIEAHWFSWTRPDVSDPVHENTVTNACLSPPLRDEE